MSQDTEISTDLDITINFVDLKNSTIFKPFYTPPAVFPTFLKVSITLLMESCGVKLPIHTLLGLSMDILTF